MPRSASRIFGVADGHALGDAFGDVTTAHFHGHLLVERRRRPDLDLDLLGGAVADEQAVHLAHVVDDRLVQLVAGDAHRLAVDDAGHRDDRDVGGAAADVDDHVAGRLGDGQAGADRRRHRLVDQVDLAGLGPQRALLHRAPLDLRDLGRHADDDARPDPHAARAGPLDEVGEHPLGGVEVGDDPVAQRLDRHHVVRRAPEHLLGAAPDRLDPVVRRVVGDDRRLVQDDAATGGEDAGVGRAEIDGKVGGEPGEVGQHGHVCFGGSVILL